MSHSTRRARASLSIAAVAALALAACGSDAKSSPTTEAPATTAAPASEAPAATEPAATEAPVATEPAATEAPAPAEAAGPKPDTLDSDYAGTEEMPPTEGPTPAEGKNVWIVVCASASEGCTSVSKGAEEAGKALGWNVTVADGGFGLGDGYNNAVRQAIAAKADAIGIIGIDCEAARASLEDAKAASIPTIAISSIDCPDASLYTASTMMNSQYPDYPEWWTQRGNAQARWLIEKTDGAAKVVASDSPSTSAITLVSKGFADELAKCSGCSISDTVTFEPIEMVTGEYASKFSAALVGAADANGAHAALDTMLLAGTMPGAIEQTGRDVFLIGGEGLASAMDLLRAGQVDVEVAFSSDWLGWGGMDTINRVLNGEPAVPQGIGWKTVDADNNLADQSAGAYQAGVDFRSAYKKLWGKA